MNINYTNDQKLIIPIPFCDCTHHSIPDLSIYVGQDILKDLPMYFKKHMEGKKALFISDQYLFDHYGSGLFHGLKEHYDVYECILNHQTPLIPNERSIGHVMMNIENDTNFLIAFGSGTINDIARYCAHRCHIPYVSIGTAPSMDGYISVIAALLNGNTKVNLPSAYPKLGIYDTSILKTAPKDLFFAGFGDVIGKYIAKSDWILSHYITEEPICPFAIELSDTAIKMCEENLDEIKNQTHKGSKVLIEALLLTGLAMLMNNNSRPAASNEHNMSHYWEMQCLMKQVPHPSHGASVGIASLYCLELFHMFLNHSFDKIDFQKIQDNKHNIEEYKDSILQNYGKTVGEQILKDNPNEPIDWETQKNRITNFLIHQHTLKQKMAFLPDKNRLISMYQKLDGPISASETGIDKQLLKSSLLYAKDYRERYNIFKLAEEMDVLNHFVALLLNGS